MRVLFPLELKLSYFGDGNQQLLKIPLSAEQARKRKNIQYPRSELQDDFLIAEKWYYYYLVPMVCCHVGGQVTPLPLSSVMGLALQFLLV